MKKDQEKTRLVERQEIYVDCTMLLKTVHSAIFDMPKKDRVVVGDRLMNYVLSMLAHFSYAWNFADVRVEETEKFLFCYYEFRSLARMCSGERKEEINLVKVKNYAAMSEYMDRIEKGIGAAIGFLCWQNAMGLYINDVVKWLQSRESLRVVVFVDDIYVVTNDKAGFLALMPELRERLAALDVRLNEKKFFCQHYSKGIRCLGTVLKFERSYINRTTVNRAFARLREWSDKRYIPIDERANMLCSLNTYFGMLKKGNNRKILQLFKEKCLSYLGRFLVWNEKKNCLGLKKKVRCA